MKSQVTPPSVLFVCVHNAGRSQMAAAFLSQLSAGEIDVRSAGSAPANSVNPVAVAAMREVGIDLSAAIPAVLTVDAVKESDVVITMGCGDACPVFPGKRYEDWQLDDPAGQGIERVRLIRDEIRDRVALLVSELLPTEGEHPDPLESATVNQRPPVLVIGAGPVGLAAAAHLVERGQQVRVLEAGASAGAFVSGWGQVRLFSPWQYNIDPAARRLLESMPEGGSVWTEPHSADLPTGAELVAEYLEPLSAHPRLAPLISYGHRVTRVTRVQRDGAGVDQTRSRGREGSLFLARVRTAAGEEDVLARAVIDASGTWETPNPVGRSGIAAIGEAEARDAGLVTSSLPDIEGKDVAKFSGKTVLVLGSGHSAANSLISLAKLRQTQPKTEIVWGLRGTANPARIFGGGSADELPARGSLGMTLRGLVDSGEISIVENVSVARIARGARLTLWLGDGRILEVDRVIPATGFRPDLTLLSELRLDLDEIVEAPRALGPLIDPELHSCGTVAAHGEGVLAHPESGVYIVGMKSYGRAPTFLMATGYEQVRSIAAALSGDRAAAEAVELELPETGVCSIDLAGSCGPAEDIAASEQCCTPNPEAAPSAESR